MFGTTVTEFYPNITHAMSPVSVAQDPGPDDRAGHGVRAEVLVPWIV